MSFHQTQVKDLVICRTNPQRAYPEMGNDSLLPSERGYRQICHNLTSWYDSKVCQEALGGISVLSKL